MNKAHGNGVNQWRNQECVCKYFRREEGLGGDQEGMGSRGQEQLLWEEELHSTTHSVIVVIVHID